MTTTNGTTYTLTELKDLRGGAAYENALAWMRSQTGMTDEEDLLIEADAFQQTFTWTGKPVRK